MVAHTVWKFNQVKESKIYYDFHVNGTCYKYLPVQVENEIMFILPGKTI